MQTETFITVPEVLFAFQRPQNKLYAVFKNPVIDMKIVSISIHLLIYMWMSLLLNTTRWTIMLEYHSIVVHPVFAHYNALPTTLMWQPRELRPTS